jgi:hypothetical protein
VLQLPARTEFREKSKVSGIRLFCNMRTSPSLVYDEHGGLENMPFMTQQQNGSGLTISEPAYFQRENNKKRNRGK